MTYKAICRRDGKFTGKTGTYDFNEDLTTAFMNKLDTNWNRIFNYEICRAFKIASEECDSRINVFRNSVTLCMGDRGLSEFQKIMFDDQFTRFSQSLRCILEDADRRCNVEQKDANRIPKAMVQKSMEKTYTECLAQRLTKPGTLLELMHMAMLQGITTNSRQMFDKIEVEIKVKVQKILTDGFGKVTEDLKHSCNSFVQDCKHFISSESRDFTSLSEEVQERIVTKLRKVDVAFQAARQAQDAVVAVSEHETKKRIEVQQAMRAPPHSTDCSGFPHQSVSSVMEQEDRDEGGSESDCEGSDNDGIADIG